jgi:hypothetical protein
MNLNNNNNNNKKIMLGVGVVVFVLLVIIVVPTTATTTTTAVYGQIELLPPPPLTPLEEIPPNHEISIAKETMRVKDPEFSQKYKECVDYIDFKNTTMGDRQCQGVMNTAKTEHCKDFAFPPVVDQEACDAVDVLQSFYLYKMIGESIMTTR